MSQCIAQIDRHRTRQVYLYFGPLTLLVYLALPDGYLLDIGTAYMLKNQLHASATQVSGFRLLTALPIYLGFLFGLARDLWNPFGLRDRGLFLIFAPLTTAVLLWMAFSPLSYPLLVSGMLLVAVAFRFMSAAYQGLLALVGQEQKMSGRLSALYNFGSFFCYALGAFTSGYLATHLTPRSTFLLAAALAGLLTLMGLWRPASVFDGLYERPEARGTAAIGNLNRLIRHRATYPALVLISLLNVSMVTGTPLQYYLSDQLNASDAVYANFTALNLLGYLPVMLLYGAVCKRVSLRRTLWLGTLISIPAAIPLAFAFSVPTILLLGVAYGMLSAIAQAAYIDLALRSSPSGTQGTLMLLVIGIWTLAFRGGDLMGSWLYTSFPGHGLSYCIAAMFAVNLLQIPALFLIPPSIMDSADGDAPSGA